MKYLIGIFVYTLLLIWLLEFNILLAVILLGITLAYVINEG